MNRRAFLLGLCGVGASAASAAALAPLVAAPAEALPLDALKNLPAATPESAPYGATPDGTPAESSYWVWRGGRRYWVPPRRRVCRRVWIGGGRWVTRCWWR